MVPLPAAYEAAFISPRNNSTTLHMFSRYSTQILVTEKDYDVTTSRGDRTLAQHPPTQHNRSAVNSPTSRLCSPPTLSHHFNSHRITRGHLRSSARPAPSPSRPSWGHKRRSVFATSLAPSKFPHERHAATKRRRGRSMIDVFFRST